VKKPRASARGFFQRKSQYDLKGTGVQNYTAIPARSSEWGILAFSREARRSARIKEMFLYNESKTQNQGTGKKL